MNAASTDIRQNGFTILRSVLDGYFIESLKQAVEEAEETAEDSNGNRAYGLRSLLHRSALIRDFAESEFVRSIAAAFLEDTPKIVKAIYFDKTPASNWKVPWH